MTLQETAASPLAPVSSQLTRSEGVARGMRLMLRDKAALASLLFLLAFLASAFAVAALVNESSIRPNFSERLLPPSLSTGHFLGTDPLGRDLLLRILFATRTSILLSLSVVLLSVSAGTILGLVSGYRGGWTDDLIMRVTDVALGFPSLLLALIVIYALGPGVTNMVIVLAFTRWMLYTRVVRAETLKLKHFSYVESARLTGGTDLWIARKHILPNVFAIISTLTVLELGSVILSESGLSFLGLGIQPPAASLGLLVAQGSSYITRAWWLVLFPGLAISLITMSLIMLSNWLAIALDPVQRWRLTLPREKRAKV